MRIIGGHDYYDGALAFGRDDDVLFIRDNLVVMHKDTPFSWHNSSIFADSYFWRDRHAHEVKGELRHVVGVSVYVANRLYYGVEIRGINGFYTVFWHYDKFLAYAVEHKLKIAKPEHWEGGRWVKDQTVEQRFQGREITRAELDWMVEKRVAIAIGYGDPRKEERSWRCNDAKDFPLKRFLFQRAVDPYSLFQEIAMFVGNWPNPGNPIVKITDDKVKAAKHGFDKWSFRKHRDDPR